MWFPERLRIVRSSPGASKQVWLMLLSICAFLTIVTSVFMSRENICRLLAVIEGKKQSLPDFRLEDWLGFQFLQPLPQIRTEKAKVIPFLSLILYKSL